ncbi:MAG: DUF512 domain-containing protein [Oscillospiraceae bacterium]
MAVKISAVKPFSKCFLYGIRSGDLLLSIDDKEIVDVLDYDFYLSFAPVTMKFKTKSGKQMSIKINNEDTGLSFDTFLMDNQHSCKNKCVFCFIDQMPKGMRKSLYFKDDDSRLSFLFGNYITLTNITEHEIERIISMHISPVNISVHTMNPVLRAKMMNNKNAGTALSIIKRFADAEIKINTQLVLCPEINDGEELKYSINELSKLYPSVQSIAAVPVGLTKFRDGLYPLKPYTKERAGETIDIIESFSNKFKKEKGIRLCYPADEFFIKAERELPNEEYYDDYPQIDNGVGLWTSLRDEFKEALNSTNAVPKYKKITLATGAAAYPLLKELCDFASEKYNIEINTKKIINNFFGENITVAGLLTGTDLIEQLKNEDLGEVLLVPLVMTIDYTSRSTENNKFLDDITLAEAEKALKIKIVPTANDGQKLLNTILGVE